MLYSTSLLNFLFLLSYFEISSHYVLWCACMLSCCSHVWLFATPWTVACPWDSPGKSTRVDCHDFLQGTFPTLEFNPHFQRFLPFRKIHYLLRLRIINSYLFPNIYLFFLGISFCRIWFLVKLLISVLSCLSFLNVFLR